VIRLTPPDFIYFKLKRIAAQFCSLAGAGFPIFSVSPSPRISLSLERRSKTAKVSKRIVLCREKHIFP
jgi:vacuolar-type H+-ATPase subunit B/Vma2